MTRFNFDVDTSQVEDYFNKLEELAHDVSNKENFLKDAGYELHTRYIRPLMPKWNPNLIYSPLEEEHQIFSVNGGLSSLELLYTGKTKIEAGGLENIFWEFALNHDKSTRRLARDYAFFQETGFDPIVNPNNYQPQHLHFVKTGSKEYQTEFHYKTMAYLDKLMRLERWERVNPTINL